MYTSHSQPAFDTRGNNKNVVIHKLRTQNEKLKDELKDLTSKLESFIEKSRHAKAPAPLVEKDPAVQAKENELKAS
jgi:hypothetical protein